MLVIKDLHAEIDGTPILNGLNLSVKQGEIHAIMGPNGAGKSTLAKVLAGHPDYEVTAGQVMLEGVDLLELEPEERALLGFFISFQYPPEISGVSNSEFLHAVLNAKKKHPLSDEVFEALLQEKMALLEMDPKFAKRDLNEGFSGGEKKRNEILQMALLEPKCSVLDETDSGLDIDALRVVSKGVNKLVDEMKGLILITHYKRLLDTIKPHFVHVMVKGEIVESGDASLCDTLEESGYEQFC